MNLKLPKLGSVSSPFKYGDRLNPARDWLVIVVIIAILLIASVGWNVWLFACVTNGDAIGAAVLQAPLNPASTASVDALFLKRADLETQYKNAHFVDPSLPGS